MLLSRLKSMLVGDRGAPRPDSVKVDIAAVDQATDKLKSVLDSVKAVHSSLQQTPRASSNPHDIRLDGVDSLRAALDSLVVAAGDDRVAGDRDTGEHRQARETVEVRVAALIEQAYARGTDTGRGAQSRLAEVEQALDDFHKSRGLVPSGAVLHQVRQMALDLGRALDQSLSESQTWPAVRVLYRNHRDEVAWRLIRPLRFWYGSSQYHEQPGYMVTAVDVERQESGRDDHTREFSFEGILCWGSQETGAVLLVPSAVARALAMEEDPLSLGDYVVKVTGDYQASGAVVGFAVTGREKVRYVVEHRAELGGFLHIYSRANLQRR